MLKNKIDDLIKKNGIKVKDFCKKIGISTAGLYDIYERNDTKLSILIKMSEILKVPVNYFIEENSNQINLLEDKNISNLEQKHKVVIQIELPEDKGDKIIKMVMGQDFLKILNK